MYNKTKKLVLLGVLALVFACNPPEDDAITAEIQLPDNTALTRTNEDTETGYDSLLAKRLGGDEYGMKKYVLALLKAGPNRSKDKDVAQKLQMEHLKNIERLANEGKLVVAGPFLDGGDLKGIYIFNVETIEEATALTNTDPAIVAGSLVMELHPWYSSAALVDVNNVHKKLSKKSITE